jgi:hypothetical protein
VSSGHSSRGCKSAGKEGVTSRCGERGAIPGRHTRMLLGLGSGLSEQFATFALSSIRQPGSKSTQDERDLALSGSGNNNPHHCFIFVLNGSSVPQTVFAPYRIRRIAELQQNYEIGSKICSTTTADGDELPFLLRCRLYSWHMNFRSSNLSRGFEIPKNRTDRTIRPYAKKMGARIETFGKSFAATELDEKQRPRILWRIA